MKQVYKPKKLLNKKNIRSRVATNTRPATSNNLLPSRPMTQTALPNSQDSSADDAFALETLEDLFSAPSTRRLSQNGDSLCDNQGHSILRIGEQV